MKNLKFDFCISFPPSVFFRWLHCQRTLWLAVQQDASKSEAERRLARHLPGIHR